MWCPSRHGSRSVAKVVDRHGVRRCGVCGATRPIKKRAEGDQPDQCARCWAANPRSWRRCEVCGQPGRIKGRTPDGGPLCVRCYDRSAPTGRCEDCGRLRKLRVRGSNGGPRLCAACYRNRRPPRRCDGCGRVREIVARATEQDPRDLCHSCFEQGSCAALWDLRRGQADLSQSTRWKARHLHGLRSPTAAVGGLLGVRAAQAVPVPRERESDLPAMPRADLLRPSPLRAVRRAPPGGVAQPDRSGLRPVHEPASRRARRVRELRGAASPRDLRSSQGAVRRLRRRRAAPRLPALRRRGRAGARGDLHAMQVETANRGPRR